MTGGGGQRRKGEGGGEGGRGTTHVPPHPRARGAGDLERPWRSARRLHDGVKAARRPRSDERDAHRGEASEEAPLEAPPDISLARPPPSAARRPGRSGAQRASAVRRPGDPVSLPVSARLPRPLRPAPPRSSPLRSAPPRPSPPAPRSAESERASRRDRRGGWGEEASAQNVSEDVSVDPSTPNAQGSRAVGGVVEGRGAAAREGRRKGGGEGEDVGLADGAAARPRTLSPGQTHPHAPRLIHPPPPSALASPPRVARITRPRSARI